MTQRKTTTTRKKTTPAKARRKAPASRGRKTSGNFVNFFVPLFFIMCILFSLGFLGFMGYRTVTASPFFDVKAIEVRGANRVSNEEIEKIVRLQAEPNGVWNADLNEIRQKIENITFVKTATVSRVLPNGLRISIVEREPKAVVRIDGGDFWADEEAVVISEAGKSDARPPFVLIGWDRSRTEEAVKNNRERVRLYREMLADWQEFELAKRVDAVDLNDLQSPKAIVRDSGETVKISLGRENFGERLQKGIKAIAGKGDTGEAVDFFGQNIIISPRKNL
jgi:hypothetical protein